MSVANNHAGDFGRAGFLDMLDRLDRAGVRWFGGGRNHAGAYQASIVQAGPLRVALVGYSDADTGLLPAHDPDGGIAVSDEWPAVLAAVRNARQQGADFVAVMPHWGQENTAEVEDRQREQARDLVQAGADLVVGSGPHRVQVRQEMVENCPFTVPALWADCGMAVRYFYVDESWDDERFCLSAIGIRHSDWHTCMKMVKDHRHRLKEDCKMFTRREIHARDLVGGRGQISEKIIGKNHRSKIFRGLLELIASMPNVKLINVCIEHHGKRKPKQRRGIVSSIELTARLWNMRTRKYLCAKN